MMRIGDRVHLLHGEIKGFPEMRIVVIDQDAQKAQIRFSRPGTQGYAYLFWRDLNDILVEDDNGHTGSAA